MIETYLLKDFNIHAADLGPELVDTFFLFCHDSHPLTFSTDHPSARLQPVASQHVPVPDGQADHGVAHSHLAPHVRDEAVPASGNDIFIILLNYYWKSFFGYSKVNRIRLATPKKSKQMQFAPKVQWWHHSSATIFRLVTQYMWLMTSQLCIFRDRSILKAFVVPKLILLFTAEGWSAQPYYSFFATLCPTSSTRLATCTSARWALGYSYFLMNRILLISSCPVSLAFGKFVWTFFNPYFCSMIRRRRRHSSGRHISTPSRWTTTRWAPTPSSLSSRTPGTSS